MLLAEAWPAHQWAGGEHPGEVYPSEMKQSSAVSQMTPLVPQIG